MKRLHPTKPQPSGWVAWVREGSGHWRAIGEFDSYHQVTRACLAYRSKAKLADTMVLPAGRSPTPAGAIFVVSGGGVRARPRSSLSRWTAPSRLEPRSQLHPGGSETEKMAKTGGILSA
jgi:hypothetical protein